MSCYQPPPVRKSCDNCAHREGERGRFAKCTLCDYSYCSNVKKFPFIYSDCQNFSGWKLEPPIGVKKLYAWLTRKDSDDENEEGK
jgi:hypothetical protein